MTLGMKCLGIPNTPHFHDITLIKDAYARKVKLTMYRNLSVDKHSRRKGWIRI